MSIKEKIRDPAFTAAHWQQQYGVNVDPFGLLNDCFYTGCQRQENLDNLRHLVHFSDHILVVTGDKGCGKTYLLEQLKEYEKDALKIVWITPGLLEGSSSLVIQLAKQMGVAVSKGETIEKVATRILETCASRFSHGLRTLFIIDDAHELSDESLELLAKRFNPRHSGAFGLVLLAQQQMIDQIRRLFPASEIQPFHQLQLRNFSAQDSANYVKYRLEKSGWSGTPAIPDAVSDKIHQLGKGLPGRINRIAASVLLTGLEQKKASGLRPRQLSVLFAGLVFTALGLAVLLVGIQYAGDSADSPKSPDSEQARYTIQLPQQAAESEDASLIPQIASEQDDAVFSKIPNTGEVEADSIEEVASDVVASDKSEQDVAAVNKLSKLPETGSSQKSASAGDVDGATTGSQMTESSKSMVVAVEGSDLVQKEPIPQEIVQKSGESTSDETGRESLAADTTAVVPKPAARTSADLLKREQAWVRSQPSGSWTIQVMGSLSEQTIRSFLNRRQDKNSYFYVHSFYQEKDWYVVLHGVYSDKEAARAGLAALPSDIQDAGAWIRSLSGVQVASD